MGYTTVITTKGQELLLKAIAGAALPLSKMVLSKQRGDDQTIGHETLSTIISGAEVTGTKLKIMASYLNDTVVTGFQIYEIGIYVNDPTDGEVLFSVSSTESPDYMPANTEHVLEEDVVMYIEVGPHDIVTTIESSVFATKAELQTEVTDLKAWASGMFALLNHNHDSVYSTKAHNHNGTYEPVITKKSGFNLDKSDSVTSTSSVILATVKGLKTAYDKAVSAYNLAAGKLGATAKAADSSKLNGVSDSTTDAGNTIAKRDSNGYLIAKIFNMSYTTTNSDVDYIITKRSSDGYMRPSTVEQVRDRVNVARVTIGTSAPSSNVNAGDIWIDPNA